MFELHRDTGSLRHFKIVQRAGPVSENAQLGNDWQAAGCCRAKYAARPFKGKAARCTVTVTVHWQGVLTLTGIQPSWHGSESEAQALQVLVVRPNAIFLQTAVT